MSDNMQYCWSICVYLDLAIPVSSGHLSLASERHRRMPVSSTYADAYQTDTPMIEINKNDISVHIYDLLHLVNIY